MIEITRYTSADASVWDDFVSRSRNATFLHRRGYMDYHSHRFDDCSLLARSDGRLVAVLPANLEGDTLCSHRGLTYGGWLLADRCDGVTMLRVMEAAAECLRAVGVRTIVYRPAPHIYHRYPAEEDRYALFRHGARLAETNLSSVIDLTCPMPFDRGNKSNVNSAVRNGVTVGESDRWHDYWRLLEATLVERYDTKPVHSLDEISLLHSRFPDNIELYVATVDDDIIAGVVVYVTATTAHCQYIAASPRGRELKALALLFSHIIERSSEAGLRYFDFGTSNEQHGKVLNESLLQQKARFGARGVVYETFTCDL